MTMAPDMRVTLRLPTGMLFEGQATHLGAVAPNGAFGIMPNHIDVVTALVPSGVRSRGPKPVPPVVTMRPWKSAASRRNVVATGSAPSSVTTRSTTFHPALSK